MLMTLPICYHAEVSTKQGRPVLRVLVKAMPFDIRELSQDEYEVSATNLDLGAGAGLRCLWHDGSNWLRESVHREMLRLPVNAAFDPGDMWGFVDGNAWRHHLSKSPTLSFDESYAACCRWLNAGMPAKSRFAGKREGDSTLEAEIGRAERALNDLRIVDGHLYKRFPVPFFRITRRHDAVIAIDGKAGPWGGFRLDRIEDLRSHMDAHMGERLARNVPSPTILMPEAFAWDDETASFNAAIDFLMETAVKHGSNLRGERHAPLYRLCGAILNYRRHGEGDMDSIADQMDEFSDFYRKETGRLPKETAVAVWSAALVSKAAAARWRLRPLSADALPEQDGMAP